MLCSLFHSFAVIGGTLNMKKACSSLKITFLASFEVILGHFRSFQHSKRLENGLQHPDHVKNGCYVFVGVYLHGVYGIYGIKQRNKVFNGLFSCSTNRLRSTNFEEMLLKNRKISKLPIKRGEADFVLNLSFTGTN